VQHELTSWRIAAVGSAGLAALLSISVAISAGRARIVAYVMEISDLPELQSSHLISEPTVPVKQRPVIHAQTGLLYSLMKDAPSISRGGSELSVMTIWMGARSALPAVWLRSPDQPKKRRPRTDIEEFIPGGTIVKPAEDF
jgi:hypothetical protein